MHIRIQGTDCGGGIIRDSGIIERVRINSLVNISKKLNFRFLSFIDAEQDTYFNEDKYPIICNEEISNLKTYSEVDPDLITLIENYAKVVSSTTCYLRFYLVSSMNLYLLNNNGIKIDKLINIDESLFAPFSDSIKA